MERPVSSGIKTQNALKVVIVHTDFRIYWPARLKALTGYLLTRDISLDIVEISGSGSPYFFAEKINGQPGNWHCLFPEERMEDISPADANLSVLNKLDETSSRYCNFRSHCIYIRGRCCFVGREK